VGLKLTQTLTELLTSCQLLFLFGLHVFIYLSFLSHTHTSQSLMSAESVFELSGPSGWSLSPVRFPEHVVIMSFPTPPWMLVHRRVYKPGSPSLGQDTLHTGSTADTGTVRLNCLAQEHNAMTPAVHEPGPLDSKFSETAVR